MANIRLMVRLAKCDYEANFLKTYDNQLKNWCLLGLFEKQGETEF